jgi:Spy/CpxP family protein refolding chaperone
MIQSNKEKLETDWLKRHTLTPEQRKQLIQNKVDRAREQSKRLNKTIGKFSWYQ